MGTQSLFPNEPSCRYTRPPTAKGWRIPGQSKLESHPVFMAPGAEAPFALLLKICELHNTGAGLGIGLELDHERKMR